MTVQDVDRPKAPLEAVELQQSHALDRGVGLLVQTREVPEHQHLPVGDVQLLEIRFVVTEVSGGVQKSQQLADVREEPVLGIRLTWAGPTEREGNDVLLVLRGGSRVGGVAGQNVAEKGARKERRCAAPRQISLVATRSSRGKCPIARHPARRGATSPRSR